MSVIPIRDVGRRLPQVGRIRLGQQVKNRPVALKTFRFTSPSQELIAKVAEIYGGQPRAWDTAKSDDRYEVITEASEIRVVLAPDAYSAYYERWRGSINDRRCDGLVCETTIPGPDGPERVERPCQCAERGVLECEGPVQRLNVILPNVRGLSVWRLDTKSEYAARELPGVVEAIQALDQGRGMIEAVLRADPRHETKRDKNGKPYRANYIVPTLDLAYSLDEMVEGAGRLSIGTGQAPAEERSAEVGAPSSSLGALPAGTHYAGGRDDYAMGGPDSADDEIVDAEIVDEATKREDIEEWAESLDPRDRNQILRRARAVAENLGEPVPATWNAITGPVLEAIHRTLNEE